MKTYRIELIDEQTGKTVQKIGGLPEERVHKAMMFLMSHAGILKAGIGAVEAFRGLGRVFDALEQLEPRPRKRVNANRR